MGEDFSNILQSVRVGCVSYLNARPLVYSLHKDIVFEHPSMLSVDFLSGKLDVALLPVFSALEFSNVVMIDGVSISSQGPVYSVVLAYRGEVNAVKKIHLDPASRTSVHLLQILCRQFLKIAPQFEKENPKECDAQLLIGDQAIQFRDENKSEWKYLDLGEVWTEHTGLPFVYAVWVVRNEVENKSAIAEYLRAVKKIGVDAIQAILQELPEKRRDFAAKYLNGYIHYDLGADEKKAIALFQKYLQEQTFLEGDKTLQYI
ncbi:MAG: menaquinone biosynthesis protein [Chthoniobacterales bacterium]